MKNFFRVALVLASCTATARAQALVSDYVNQIVPTVSTVAQAQYYADQMKALCSSANIKICSCVGKSVYHDAITGQFSETYRLTLLSQANKDDSEILKGPSDQIERSVSIDFVTLQYFGPGMVADEYQRLCKKWISKRLNRSARQSGHQG